MAKLRLTYHITIEDVVDVEVPDNVEAWEIYKFPRSYVPEKAILQQLDTVEVNDVYVEITEIDNLNE